MRPKHSIALAAALTAVLAAAPATDGPSLKELMRRVAEYVQAYGDRASLVVATEHYAQRVSHERQVGFRERSMVAELAIVYVEAEHMWLGFRDVSEVDGRRIPDREDRLIEVLTQAQGTYNEALRINDESARYNIGSIDRNFNVPTAVLFFFTPENLDRFKFSLRARGGAVWEIGFRETSRPTLIRTRVEGRSVPASGSLWVEPATGRIVRTHLRVSDFILAPNRPALGTGDIDVTYRLVESLDMWLPDVMTESYLVNSRPAWSQVTGRATYGNYRRFQTSARMK